MYKLYFDIACSFGKEFDVRSDYRFPERLNGMSLEEIREYATDFISRMPNTLVLFAEKPYGKGSAYFYNQEDPSSINEVVYACSEDLQLNVREIVKYLDKDIVKRRLRVYLYLGENGCYAQLPLRKLARFAREEEHAVYEDGKSVQNLLDDGYFAQFTEEGYLPAFAASGEQPAAATEE